jgi:polar amino acid transport system substrate-binding protein
MKLAPVTAWLVRDRPRLKVVETGITREFLGICVRRGDDALRGAINESQRALLEDGTPPRLVTKWLRRGARLGDPRIA